MIKFFRKIRQNLISEKKSGVYLKYALGEILLVVIGILLAVQVNNWNENRKAKKQEQVLLQSLKEEFAYNLNELSRVIDINLKNKAAAEQLASNTGPVQSNLSEKEIAVLWGKAFKDESIFRPSPGILNETINSGKLGLLSNKQLRSFLASWGSELQRIQIQENAVTDLRWSCYSHLLKKGNFRKILDLTKDDEPWYTLAPGSFENDNVSMLQSQAFENDIILFIGASVYLNEFYYKPLKNHIEQIILSIEANINTKNKKD